MAEWEPDEDVRGLIRKYALQNALEYDGKGVMGSVLGRMMGESPELRQFGKHLPRFVSEAVEEANQLWNDSGADHVRDMLASESPEALEKRVKEKREGLPDLDGDTMGATLRFAPNPNGPLTLGHSRGVVINAAYAKMYNGRVILRFDDTDTKKKRADPEAYDWIVDDYHWLTGVEQNEPLKASSRMDTYLSLAGDWISDDHLYVCECPAEDFKVKREAKEECPCRSLTTEEHKARWKRMLDPEGGWMDGSAVVRVKTGMDHKNPALRDWPALRIQTPSHPLVGDKFRVWPLLDFQSAIDDHREGVTHIIRGKDLIDSTRKQMLLYEMVGWNYPETNYWGRVKVHEFGGFSTSQMRMDIADGTYEGWDDPRLPTIKALRRRGYTAKALREFWSEFGLTQKDIQVPLSTLDAHNARIIDAETPRVSFIRDPVRIALDCSGVELQNSISMNKHPEYPEMGQRVWPLDSDCGLEVLVEAADFEAALEDGGALRLKDFADIIVDANRGGSIQSLDKSDSRAIVNWLLSSHCQETELYEPSGDVWAPTAGVIEAGELKVGSMVQMERVGFAKVEASDRLIWTHK